MELFGSNFRLFGRQREAAPPASGGAPGVPTSTMPPDIKPNTMTGADYEERIVYARSPEVACTVSAVYHATALRGDTMGVMPVQYRKKDTEKGNFTQDNRGLGRRINYLLQVEPNPIMTATDMWRLVEINRLFYGNAFIYIERDEFGFPQHLWLVRQTGYNINDATYVGLVYMTDKGYVTLNNVPAEDVMHFPNTFRYPNGWGIPTLWYAYEVLTLNKTIRSQALENAAKGGKVKLFISEERPQSAQSTVSLGFFNPTELDEYAKKLQRQVYSGHDIIATRGADKITPISMTAAEMEMVAQANMTYDDVARFWGVPRPLVMLDTNSHYTSYGDATMEFLTRTILPQKTGNEKEIFRKLIGVEGYGMRDIHICEQPLLTMDPERQAKVDMLNLQTGAKTVNEIRREHDMPSVTDGDEPMASANLLTLKALIAKSDAAVALKPGNYTVDGQQDAND